MRQNPGVRSGSTLMLADIPIHLADLADAPDIAALSRTEIEHGLGWSWTPERVARAVRDPETNVIVAGRPGDLAGFGIMSYLDDDAHLLLFAVRAGRRRQGLGSAILAWLEAVAATAGAKRIRVEARWDNVAGRSFYSERGYHEGRICRAMYGGRLDGVRLEKWLRDA
jgi:ribosomal-protein-alanine N-acetyltransferase